MNLPRRQPAGRRLRPDQQRRQGRRLRHAARLPAAVVGQRRLAAGGGQLPAAQLQRGAHPPGAGQPLHARCGRRDGPDDHRRDRHPRLQRPGLRRRARQHGQPRPRPGAARPQPPGGHPLEPGQRAELRQHRLRAVRAGPVRGDERQRRHPADQRRRRLPAPSAEPLPEHDVRQLRPSSPHYLDGFGHYGESCRSGTGRPDGEGEYIWPACNTKQGFEWFATATAAKRGKDASDLRPYTLLSAWAGFVPGVRTTDFTPEEGGHPVYGADNLTDPWSNPQIQRIQAAFNPIAAIDLPYWSASGASDSNGAFPLPQAVPAYAPGSTVTRNITVFNDDFTNTSVGFTWTAHLDQPDRHGHRLRHHHPHHPARLPRHPAGHLHRPGHRLAGLPGAVHHQVRHHHLQRRGRVLHPRRQAAAPDPPRAPTTSSTATAASPWPSPATPPPTAPRPSSRAAPPPGPSAPRRRRLHPALHRHRQGARRQRRLHAPPACNCNSGPPTAAPTSSGTCEPTGDGYYTIVSHDSGLVADVYGASTSDGAQVVQWTANGGTNQQWQFVPA